MLTCILLAAEGNFRAEIKTYFSGNELLSPLMLEVEVTCKAQCFILPGISTP